MKKYLSIILFISIFNTLSFTILISDDNIIKKKDQLSGAHSSVKKNNTLYDRFSDGGPFMWPLLVGGIFVLVLTGERTFVFFKKGLFHEEKRFAIEEYVLKARLSIEKDESRRDALIDIYGNELYRDLNKGLDSIQLVGALAPMIGFLGTASGMITSFSSIVKSNAVTPKLVAGGIEEALLTTAFGLIIAIPSLIVYHFLSQRVDGAIHDFNRIIVDPYSHVDVQNEKIKT